MGACCDLYAVRVLMSCFTKLDGVVCKCIDLRFVDSEFEANSKSINNKDTEGKYYAWMRAHELSLAKGNEGLHLFKDGISPGDLCQGGLGDCWLM